MCGAYANTGEPCQPNFVVYVRPRNVPCNHQTERQAHVTRKRPIREDSPGTPRTEGRGGERTRASEFVPRAPEHIPDRKPWTDRKPSGIASSDAAPKKGATGRPEPWFKQKRERQGGREPLARTAPDITLIWGFHSVREALRARRRKLVRLWATQPAADKLAPEIEASEIELNVVALDEIDRRVASDAVHQGVLLEARALPVVDLEDLPANGFLLVLDQVTDPHNVGAILRTAAAFGVTGIVTTERHSPAHTGVLAKAASGGLEHVPIASVVNLARALESLGKMGYLRVGLDSDGPESLEDTVLSHPLALVLGAEGKGLRRLTRENCDVLARIDLPGAVRSLNVSNACAVALTITRMKLSKT